MRISRDFLNSADKRFLLHGKKKQADVYVVHVNDTPQVVKDYREKGLFVRLYGCYTLWREWRNYQFLQQFDFVPRLLDRIDPYAFTIEYIDGPTVAEMEGDPDFCFIPDKLWHAVRTLHQHRFFHLDLRKRGNIMVRDGRILLIDFASSIHFSKWNPFYWLLRPVLAYADVSAVIKWKSFICPDSLTPGDLRFLRRFEWVRMLWFFNKPRLPKMPRENGNGD